MSYSASPPYDVTTIVVRTAARELHREAAELRGERDVRAEHLEVLRADRRDVHRVRDEAAVERGGDLLGDDDAGAVLRLSRRGGEMRRDDDVVELEQRARVRLGREDVERRACDLAALERLEQRVLVDELAACGVDEAHAVAHTRERGRVDRPARLVAQRQVEREELRSVVDLLRRLDALDAELAEPLARSRTGRRRRRACRGRARGVRPAGRCARSRARRASSRRARCRRTSCAPSVPASSAACACGMFRASATSSPIVCSDGGDDRRLRRVRDDDPAPRRRVDVDVVDADARAADHLQVHGAFDQLGRELRRRAHDDRVVAADDLLERRLRVDVDVEAGTQELDARVGDRLADEDLRGHATACARTPRAPRSRRRRARCPRRARRATSSTAASAVVMSKTSNQPMWPMPEDLPLEIALSVRDRHPEAVAQRRRRCRSASIPSGARTAVTTALRSSSGEKSSRPIAFTPAREARPSRTCRSNAASSPSVEEQAERDVEAGDERDRRRERASSLRLRLARPLPVEVEARCDAGRGRARASETAQSPRPGGVISAFCEPETTTSRPHASVSHGTAPRLDTASTTTSAPASFATAAIAWMSATTPVDVSDWTTQTALASRSAQPRAHVVRVRRLAPRVAQVVDVGAVAADVIAAQRSPKLPAETTRCGSPGETRFATADSKAPVPEAVKRRTSSAVRQTSRSRVRQLLVDRPEVRARGGGRPARPSAASTCGGTGVGPGVNR